MSDKERAEVLQLLARGKITAAEAAELLTQVEQGDVTFEEAPEEEKSASGDTAETSAPQEIITLKRDEALISENSEERPKWLRIRVRDLNTNRNKVTVNLPMWVVSMGLGAASAFGVDVNGVDVKELRRLVQEGERGMLVEVEDHEDGEHVQIYLD